MTQMRASNSPLYWKQLSRLSKGGAPEAPTRRCVRTSGSRTSVTTPRSSCRQSTQRCSAHSPVGDGSPACASPVPQDADWAFGSLLLLSARALRALVPREATHEPLPPGRVLSGRAFRCPGSVTSVIYAVDAVGRLNCSCVRLCQPALLLEHRDLRRFLRA
jgi:hypothetical protein